MINENEQRSGENRNIFHPKIRKAKKKKCLIQDYTRSNLKFKKDSIVHSAWSAAISGKLWMEQVILENMRQNLFSQ